MAANAERGEVDLVAGDQTYTLVLDVNALCIMEKRTGKTFGAILNGIIGLDMTATREYLRAVLASNHGRDIGIEAKKRNVDPDILVGEIFKQAGMKNVKNALIEIFRLNTPEAEQKPKEGAKEANPPAAQDGTGDSFTSTVAVTA